MSASVSSDFSSSVQLSGIYHMAMDAPIIHSIGGSLSFHKPSLREESSDGGPPKMGEFPFPLLLPPKLTNDTTDQSTR